MGKPWRKMTRLILPVVVCLVVAVVGDSSAQGNTQVAATPSEDVSQHSIVKREAKRRKKQNGERRKRRRKMNPSKAGRKRGGARGQPKKMKSGRRRARGKDQGKRKKKKDGRRRARKGGQNAKTKKKRSKGRGTRKRPVKKGRKIEKGRSKQKKKKKSGSKTEKEKKQRRKRKRNFFKNQRQNETQTSINYTECTMKMKEFASRIKKAGNLERQSKRITDFKKINDNKKAKKGNFNKTLTTLISSLGGNTSSPSCRTSGVNFTDQLTILNNCMKNIESNCSLEMSTEEMAEIKACEDAGKALFEEVDNCIKPSKTLEDSCTCFIALANTNLDIVKSCNISGKNNAAKDAKKICTSGFGACKKAEAAVVNIVDQCKPEKKCVTPNHTSPSSTVPPISTPSLRNRQFLRLWRNHLN